MAARAGIPFTDRQMAAGAELRRAGSCSASVVMFSSRWSPVKAGRLSELCRTHREKNTTADCLRALLDDLSWLWGYRR